MRVTHVQLKLRILNSQFSILNPQSSILHSPFSKFVYEVSQPKPNQYTKKKSNPIPEDRPRRRCNRKRLPTSSPIPRVDNPQRRHRTRINPNTQYPTNTFPFSLPHPPSISGNRVSEESLLSFVLYPLNPRDATFPTRVVVSFKSISISHQ
ncbi:hypothetical protein OCU04_003575 [Sclerotinia nivalis]|uniref:Uncharacterized protein n=1 Tax=Sclerotinia nivalis TaxID=352851 RepID=A0A9X0DND4_9HELO|nr:hypothetical protein OCU04_003575 [Sclerotinia nivalis]